MMSTSGSLVVTVTINTEKIMTEYAQPEGTIHLDDSFYFLEPTAAGGSIHVNGYDQVTFNINNGTGNPVDNLIITSFQDKNSARIVQSAGGNTSSSMTLPVNASPSNDLERFTLHFSFASTSGVNYTCSLDPKMRGNSPGA